MKIRRLLSMLLSVIFVFVCLPIPAEAKEKNYTENEIYQLAAEAFPEFEGKIIHSNTIYARIGSTLSDDFTTVFCETRKISETESVTYQEFANGANLISFTVDQVSKSSTSGSGYSYHVVDFYVLSSLAVGCLTVSNFSYTLISSAYDQINSFGITSTSTVDAGQDLYTRSQESSAGPAYARYYGDFPIEVLEHCAVRCYLTVNVGNNQCTVSTSSELVVG